MSDPVERRQVTLIGVGAGTAGQLTADAASAIGALDVVVAISKGEGRDHLLDRRLALIAQHGAPGVRTVQVDDPVRSAEGSYVQDVNAWHAERARRIGDVLRSIPSDERIGILVWGDPSLYDSTIRLLELVEETTELALDVDVIAGISSIQLLAAAHRIVLHRVGGSFLVTTGRRLAAGEADDADDVVVLLDANCSFRRFVGRDYDLYWGAYLGDEMEVLRSGHLDDIADEVESLRGSLRDRNGWMFDTYLLRRRS